MKRFILIFISILLFIVSCWAQQINAITSRCQYPEQYSKSSVRLNLAGEVIAVPCPTKSIDFTGATKTLFWNKDFVNFQNASAVIALGDTHPNFTSARRTLTGQTHFIDIEPVIDLTSANSVNGIFSVIYGKGVSNSSFYGITGGVNTTGNTAGSSSLHGIYGFAYVRSDDETIAYGGKFETFTGGNNNQTNTTPLYGVYASVAGGHSGTTPLQVAGKFVSLNLGGGGVGNITEARGVEIVIDGAPVLTNYITAKGIALEGWTAASGGTFTNSYGIYADTSIDRGTNRYFIYSLSTSPSRLSGDVYISDTTKGIILKSPDGTCYRFTVANGGALSAGASVTCP